MGSDTPLKIPVIDFSKLGRNSDHVSEWNLVKWQALKALEEYGCFEAIFDKISMKSRKAIFDAVEELFGLPLETKLRNTSEMPYYGYLGQKSSMPLYECLSIDDANMVEKVESMTRTMWPQGNPSFREPMLSFSEKVSELDQMIRRMIVESLGLEKYMEEHMNSSNYFLRASKYEGPQTTETKLGIPPHTDKNMVTILYQNQVDGFEVQTKDGDWISVKLRPDSFIVLIGESLHGWTNGRLHPPTHRVMMSGNETRYSVGLFGLPKAGYIIKVPEELIDEEHPLLYKPFDHLKFIEFVHSEEAAGQKDQPTLRTYCGV